jgi:predicted site-specific integrase-resolvase
MGPRDEDLLTVAEVARIRHVSISTVHRWITEGNSMQCSYPAVATASAHLTQTTRFVKRRNTRHANRDGRF